MLALLPTFLVHHGPRPARGHAVQHIKVGPRLKLVFSSEREEVEKHVTELLPNVLAGLVAEFATGSPDLKEYVTLFVDPELVVQNNGFHWDPILAQCLSNYCPLPSESTNLQTIDKDCPGTSLLLPWQKVASETMVSRTRDIHHIDPMDVVHRLDQDILFTREGYLAKDTNDLMKTGLPEPRMLTLPGCLLTEATGTGKTRSVLATLKEVYGQPISTPTPRGRTTLQTMAIVAPSHTMDSWRKEIKVMMPDWSVLFIQDKRSLHGLHAKLYETTIHLVVFCINIFQSNKKTLKSFFSSSLEHVPWSEDHQLFWTTMWHTVVIDEVHTLVPSDELIRRRPKTISGDTCCIDRQALIIKSLVPGHYSILMSATPQVESPLHADTYLYLMGLCHDNISVYPTIPTLHDHIRSKPWMTQPGGKPLYYFVVSEEIRAKAHNLLRKVGVVNTGTKVEVDIRTQMYEYHESSQFVEHPLWQRRITPYLTFAEEEEESTFATQCGRRIEEIIRQFPHARPEYYQSLQKCATIDQDNTDLLGTMVGLREEVKVMNSVQVHQGLTPVQSALVRILVWLISTEKAKILIYSEPAHYVWKNTEECLRVYHNIKMVHFSGTVHHLNKKRQRLEMDVAARTVMFLPNNHLSGTNFGFVTHVLIVGRVTDQANYDQFIGRATRWGRKSPLTILTIRPRP
jgi:hypothetical protein